MSNQFDDLNKKVQKITMSKIKLKKNYNVLQTEQNSQAKIIAELEAQVDYLKQKEFKNNIIISNLPNSNFDKKDLLSKIIEKFIQHALIMILKVLK